MMLDDQTNHEIPLAMHGGGSIYVDIDQDSSIWPDPWVWITADHDEEFATRLTLEEAGKLHDRLGLILQRVSLDVNDIHVPHGPATVPPAEADAAYLRSAAERWRSSRLMGFNLTTTVAGILETIAEKLHPDPKAGGE